MRAIIRELFETVILALLIFLALHVSVQNFRVQGPSMRPTLEMDEHVIVNKLVYWQINPQKILGMVPFLEIDGPEAVFPFHPPRRGEVIIFRFPQDESRDFVKRVIGLPGDSVEINRGEVYVNGIAIAEPYVNRKGTGDMAAVLVEEGSYFVLGDNRTASHDSRHWGVKTPVRGEHLIGRAWVSFWPLDRWQALLAFPWR